MTTVSGQIKSETVRPFGPALYSNLPNTLPFIFIFIHQHW